MNELKAYEDPNHPSNVIRPRTRCWGCGKLGCVGKHWGNWCFKCNNERIGRISTNLELATRTPQADKEEKDGA